MFRLFKRDSKELQALSHCCGMEAERLPYLKGANDPMESSQQEQ